MPSPHKALPPSAFGRPRDRQRYRDSLKLFRQYADAIDGLKEIGVQKTDRAAQADFSEWVACRLLDLQPAPTAVQESYDATDRAGVKYQIKARQVSSLTEPTSFDSKARPKRSVRFLVAVFCDPRFRILGIAKVPYAVVVKYGSQTAGRFSFRWHHRMTHDPRIEWIFSSISKVANLI